MLYKLNVHNRPCGGIFISREVRELNGGPERSRPHLNRPRGKVTRLAEGLIDGALSWPFRHPSNRSWIPVSRDRPSGGPPLERKLDIGHLGNSIG